VSNYTLLQGHCLEVLRTLPTESVQTCITSPPYFGLRDYGCDGQIGLESTPDSFVASLVDVFAEVHRVLKKDGTLWLNLGDSYAAQRGGTSMPAETLAGGVGGKGDKAAHRGHDGAAGHAHRNASNIGLKHKDLIGIPWRVAFALQSYGWYLRQDIIWHKPNPMPESVTDRCTKAHEYIFLLSKSDRYFYDNEAIKEPVSDVSIKRSEYGWNCDRPSTKNASMGGTGIHTEKMGTRFVNPSGRNKRSVWTVNTKPYKGAHFAVYPTELIRPCVLAGSRPGDVVLDPFNGSGTTGFVSIEERRKYIGIDINTEYLAIAEARIKSAQVQETMEFDSEA
jgi:DNA modification methylase